MRVLHTSDWHLGATLYTKRRYDEAEKFLEWLLDTIESEKIDALLIAGDIFDTTLASNRAQSLYYRFLQQVSASCCRDVVVIGGNHDSPTFLDAPRELLRALRVHVIASARIPVEEEIISLKDRNGNVSALVAAVPFLHDRDIRSASDGETLSDKQEKLIEGLRLHYQEAYEAAVQIMQTLSAPVPLIAMGHLFCAGGSTVEGDGVRDLYVGSLAHINASLLPPGFDYYAFGHLHSPQKVGGCECIRYSGAPLPMGFGEASRPKAVIIVQFDTTEKQVRELAIPTFRNLIRITGEPEHVMQELEQLRSDGVSAYIEVENTSAVPSSLTREELEVFLSGSSLELLSLKNRMVRNEILKRTFSHESLDDIDEKQVFQRLLNGKEFDEELKERLSLMYQEVLYTIQTEDGNRE